MPYRLNFNVFPRYSYYTVCLYATSKLCYTVLYMANVICFSFSSCIYRVDGICGMKNKRFWVMLGFSIIHYMHSGWKIAMKSGSEFLRDGSALMIGMDILQYLMQSITASMQDGTRWMVIQVSNLLRSSIYISKLIMSLYVTIINANIKMGKNYQIKMLS